MERLIVKDFRNELKGHKERLQQSHRVRDMLNIMQERAKKLVRLQLQQFDIDCAWRLLWHCNVKVSSQYICILLQASCK